ncbi:phage holin family protein [Clostridium kluyveri]|uniref:phage holin family protein n=1 Tax=Clostridium kluyveri TaxID=1534 RepID=UPI0009FA3E70|nr:phage holin family protein [Clostridium kluyveri]UZQ52232.1 phage holin family protein [Clostridium kluyveri]
MNKHIFNSIVARVGGVCTYVFGGWDTPIIVLFWSMGVDYATGLLSAAVQNKLNSKVGYKGIAKKASILVVLIVAVLLDRLLNSGIYF